MHSNRFSFSLSNYEQRLSIDPQNNETRQYHQESQERQKRRRMMDPAETRWQQPIRLTEEPRPIATRGIRVVEKVALEDASWCSDDQFILLDALRPLLRRNYIATTSWQDDSSLSSCLLLVDKKKEKYLIPQELRRITRAVQSTAAIKRESMSPGNFHGSCEEDNHNTLSDSLDDASTSSPSTSAWRSHNIEQQWHDRFQELVDFKKEHGHCMVPINWHANAPLAQWVKRQRYQSKLKQEGKRSALSDERQEALEQLGFTWRSRGLAWEERYSEMCAFHETYGHCNISHYFPKTSSLALWAKGQRRQFKSFCHGKTSSITKDRIAKLNRLGFDWDPRNLLKRKSTTDLI
jgi:hypothetical protein